MTASATLKLIESPAGFARPADAPCGRSFENLLRGERGHPRGSAQLCRWFAAAVRLYSAPGRPRLLETLVVIALVATLVVLLSGVVVMTRGG